MPFPPVQPLILLDLETSIVADFFFSVLVQLCTNHSKAKRVRPKWRRSPEQAHQWTSSPQQMVPTFGILVRPAIWMAVFIKKK